MHRLRLSFLMGTVVLLMALALSQAAPHVRHAQAAATFRIAGAVEKPGGWTVERVTKEFASDIHPVQYTIKGQQSTARCVSLLSLVQAAKPRLDPKIKNHQLAFEVMVRAKDGYAVAFSLGELLPQFGNRAVWIALDKDGQPLPDDMAPVQLLVPDDAKPARWVRAVSEITVVDGAQGRGKKE